MGAPTDLSPGDGERRPEPGSPRLRIAAHNGAPIWGGAEVALVRLLAGLAGRGHEVRLYANNQEVVERARDQGVPAERLPLGGDVAIHHAFRMAGALRRLQPDVLLLGTFRKTWLGALAGRLAGMNRVVARIGLETDVPRSAKYRFVFDRWIHGAAFNADGMRRRFMELLPTFAGRAVTVHSWVPTPPAGGGAELRQALGIPPDALVVGSVGRLAEQKRYDRLVRAVAGIPDAHALIVGEGPARGDVVRAAAEAGVADRVHLPGHQDDVAPALDAMDVFVISSDREGMSNAMLEAMAAGVPVVSTDVSGAREALAPESEDPAGLVVETTTEALVDALVRLAGDPELRQRLGGHAADRAAREFGREPLLDRWESFLRGDVVPAPAGGS